MQAAFDYAVEYVHQRKQFGQPVGTFQLMQGTTKAISDSSVNNASFYQERLQICTQIYVLVERTFIAWLVRATKVKSAPG
jgi:hypothetical protein